MMAASASNLSALARRLLAFGLTGGIGFAVDAGLTTALVKLGIGPLLARIGGVAIAVAVTWLVNRSITFSDRKSTRRASEASRYAGVALTGTAVNYVVYAAALHVSPQVPIVAAVALGSLAAMIVTYLGYSRFVFRR